MELNIQVNRTCLYILLFFFAGLMIIYLGGSFSEKRYESLFNIYPPIHTAMEKSIFGGPSQSLTNEKIETVLLASYWLKHVTFHLSPKYLPLLFANMIHQNIRGCCDFSRILPFLPEGPKWQDCFDTLCACAQKVQNKGWRSTA